MAKNTLVKKIFKFNWQESYASLILGAIIVIILGLLVANYFTRKNQGTIDEADMTKLTQEEETKPVEGSDYKIKENDSLSKISQEGYGSQEYWNALAVVNNIVNPNVIWVNTTIKLPDKDDLTKTKETLMGTSYEVQEGETLFTIAQKVYGDGSKWTILDRANGFKRLPNGNPLVYAGSTLKVPR